VSDRPDLPRGPRVIIEEEAPPQPRLDFQWEQAVVPVPAVAVKPEASKLSGIGRALAGAGIIAGGLATLSAVNFVVDQFARGPIEGLATLGILGVGGALLGGGLWRELRGLAAIRRTDEARTAFATGDLAAARAEALRWAASVEQAASLQPALRQAQSIDEIQALIAPVQQALETQAASLGRTAAMQAFAMTAISPSAGLDVLIFTWRGIKLVRQVASLYGLRPGAAGTIALLRRTLIDAATVGATDIAVDTAARALLSNPLLKHVAGEAASGAVAARRMLRLAAVTADSCRLTPR
jgi:putative membrane protein